MRMCLEIALAALAVLGLISLIWLFFGWLLVPIGGRSSVTVLPASGDGEALEQDLNGLLWLRDGGLLKGGVVIADCGLSAAGRALAQALALRQPGVELLAADRIEAYIRGGH